MDFVAEDRTEEVKGIVADDLLFLFEWTKGPIGRTFSEDELKTIEDDRKERPRLHWKQVNLESRQRTILDQLKGRQEFNLGQNRFLVQRGIVIDFGMDDPYQGYFSYREYVP